MSGQAERVLKGGPREPPARRMLGPPHSPPGSMALAALAGPLCPESSAHGGEGALEHVSPSARASVAGLDTWDSGCPARHSREGHSQGTSREPPAVADLGQASSKAVSCLRNEVPMLVSEAVRGTAELPARGGSVPARTLSVGKVKVLARCSRVQCGSVTSSTGLRPRSGCGTPWSHGEAGVGGGAAGSRGHP